MTSVRRRLLLGTAVATVAIFLAAAVSLYVVARKFLISELDAGVRGKARTIAAMIDLHDTGTTIEADDALRMPEFQPAAKDLHYFEVVSADGRRVLASPSLGERRLEPGLALPHPRAGARFIQLPDGRRGRAVTVVAKAQVEGQAETLAPGIPKVIAITVAKATTELDRLLGLLWALFGIVCGVATVALLGITALLIRSGLRPLERLARQISAIGAADLNSRLDQTQVPRELAPVVSRLNDLLGRLESAFEREKCFTADAAHELRTPLSGLEAALEVCASRRRDTQRYEQVVGDCLKVVRQMRAMVEDLLMLARADADRVSIARGDVDIPELIEASWSVHQGRAEQRRLNVELELVEELVVETDREKLAIIVNNLMENAVSYADEGGQIRIKADASGQAVSITVTNSGSRVRPEDSSRVFDRFWRADASRSSNEQGRHCGLGLAVCRKLATALGAQLAVQSTAQGLFIAHLELAGPAKRPIAQPHLEKNLRIA